MAWLGMMGETGCWKTWGAPTLLYMRFIFCEGDWRARFVLSLCSEEREELEGVRATVFIGWRLE